MSDWKNIFIIFIRQGWNLNAVMWIALKNLQLKNFLIYIWKDTHLRRSLNVILVDVQWVLKLNQSWSHISVMFIGMRSHLNASYVINDLGVKISWKIIKIKCTKFWEEMLNTVSEVHQRFYFYIFYWSVWFLKIYNLNVNKIISLCKKFPNIALD